MSESGQKRPWLAALLSLAHPGLGHLYLREWLRTVLWFGLFISAAAVMIPPEALPQTMSIDAYTAAAQNMPLSATIALLAIIVPSMADAYLLARRTGTDAGAGAAVGDGTASCPNCGREVDADLEFCHWCTERLDTRPDGPEGGSLDS